MPANDAEAREKRLAAEKICWSLATTATAAMHWEDDAFAVFALFA